METVIVLDQNTGAVIVAALFAVSEALSLIPAVRSNGVFQLLFSVFKRLARR